MDSVLIVSNTNTTMGIISLMLQSQSFNRIVTTQDGSEARRYLLDGDFDLIIIDTPLKNEFGDEFALSVADHSGAGVVLVVDNHRLDDISMIVEGSGIFCVPKPISPDFFYQAVKFLMTAREKYLKLENENRKLQKKLDEEKSVSRAKCLLIEHLNMTEAQAHKHIEKQAMDQRLSRTEIADSIMRRYR